jgi:penicillin-insensitive murein DD-endopeptidase
MRPERSAWLDVHPGSFPFDHFAGWCRASTCTERGQYGFFTGRKHDRQHAAWDAQSRTAAAARQSQCVESSSERAVRSQSDAAARSGPVRPIGSYANGCLAGAVTLPITGPTWQVMRLSRDRNWGTPRLVNFIRRLADNAKKVGWNGLLIGDMAQPRGGPMINGHASHQIGLDVDIWFKPMPDHVLSREEREMDPAVNVVSPDGVDVDHKVWTSAYTEVVKTAAEDPSVTRIFVNAAIKKELCSEAGTDRRWLAKVRPWWGHSEHFHIRLACPDYRECKGQPPVPTTPSICGSGRPSCTLHRRKCRPSQSRRSLWPRCRSPAERL